VVIGGTDASDPKGAVLRMDVRVRPADRSRPTDQRDQAALGDLQTYGVTPKTAQRTVTWSEVPATLTATGAGVLPGEAFEGSDLGPMTTMVPPAKSAAWSPPPPAQSRAGNAPAAQATGSPSAGPAATGEPTDCATPTASTTASPTGSPTATPTATPTGTPTA